MNKATVILSFYKRIDYLKLLLAGFERQSFNEFEIIIADDGSPLDISKQIESISSQSSFTLKHVWHEDLGFRKNKILNSAVRIADSEYLIFIDGDCVPHKAFVGEHYNNSSPGVCLTGRRVNLSEKLTRSLSEDNIRKGYLEHTFNNLVCDGVFGRSYDVEKGFYLKANLLRRFTNNKKRGLLGCNFSLYKKDLLAINGFDERYTAPSIGEDSDIQYRLELTNVKIKSLNNIAVQYHLYHKLQERPLKNIELFEKIKSRKEYFTPFGIHKT